MNYTKHQITREIKAAEIYIGDSIKQNIRAINYQTRKGVQKAPLNYLGNTYGGMAKINGRWYIFYHRQTNKQKCCKQGCAEKITILPDGSIPQAELTSCGLNGGALSGKGSYEARIACHLMSREGTFKYEKSFEKDEEGIHPYFTQSGEDREENGDQYIANMTDGSVAGFKYFQFEGTIKIQLMTRGSRKGKVEIRTALDGSVIGQIPVEPSEKWHLSSVENVAVPEGISALYFTYIGEGYMDFNRFELL